MLRPRLWEPLSRSLRRRRRAIDAAARWFTLAQFALAAVIAIALGLFALLAAYMRADIEAEMEAKGESLNRDDFPEWATDEHEPQLVANLLAITSKRYTEPYVDAWDEWRYPAQHGDPEPQWDVLAELIEQDQPILDAARAALKAGARKRHPCDHGAIACHDLLRLQRLFQLETALMKQRGDVDAALLAWANASALPTLSAWSHWAQSSGWECCLAALWYTHLVDLLDETRPSSAALDRLATAVDDLPRMTLDELKTALRVTRIEYVEYFESNVAVVSRDYFAAIAMRRHQEVIEACDADDPIAALSQLMYRSDDRFDASLFSFMACVAAAHAELAATWYVTTARIIALAHSALGLIRAAANGALPSTIEEGDELIDIDYAHDGRSFVLTLVATDDPAMTWSWRAPDCMQRQQPNNAAETVVPAR